MTNYNLAQDIAELISKSKTKDAIKICINQFDADQNHIQDLHEAIVLISSRFSTWESNSMKGFEPEAKILNQIHSAIINWVNLYVEAQTPSKKAEVQASIQNTQNKVKASDENKIHASIKARIENKAKTDYPTDFQMQKHIIDGQWAAFHRLEKASPNIPVTIFEVIRNKAKDSWPNDYKMQEHVEKQEIEAFEKLQSKKPTDIPQNIWAVITKKASLEYPTDFQTQKHIIDQQVKDFRNLKQFKFMGIPKDTLKIIFQKATSEYPNDFTMQEYIIKQQIQAYQALN